jgi:hypothetical protein
MFTAMSWSLPEGRLQRCMFNGDRTLRGSLLSYPTITGGTTMTFFCFLAEFHPTKSKIVSVIHSLFAWPTLFEGFCFPIVLWSLRHVERLLGRRVFIVFLLYNYVAYVPFYFPCMFGLRWYSRISMLYFHPYALFIFMLAQIPAIPVFLALSDKLMVTLLFLLLIAIQLPCSLVPLASAIIGNLCWSFDVFRLSRFTTGGAETEHRQTFRRRRPPPQEPEPQDDQSVADRLDTICQMGFDHSEAAEALRRSRNNLQGAIEYLLSH